MSLSTKITILKISSLSLIAFGMLNFLSLFAVVQPAMQLFLDIAFWSDMGGQHGLTESAARLWVGISGGLLAGWGVTLLLIVTQVYTVTPAVGARIIVSGISVWFILDSAGSVAAGAPFNAVMNLGFVVMFVVTIIWPEHKSAASSVAS